MDASQFAGTFMKARTSMEKWAEYVVVDEWSNQTGTGQYHVKLEFYPKCAGSHCGILSRGRE